MFSNDILLDKLGHLNLNQLMALDACRPLCEDSNLNSSLSVTSPLIIINNWSRELSFHSDKVMLSTFKRHLTRL